jgi:hypothetical protein
MWNFDAVRKTRSGVLPIGMLRGSRGGGLNLEGCTLVDRTPGELALPEQMHWNVAEMRS